MGRRFIARTAQKAAFSRTNFRATRYTKTDVPNPNRGARNLTPNSVEPKRDVPARIRIKERRINSLFRIIDADPGGKGTDCKKLETICIRTVRTAYLIQPRR